MYKPFLHILFILFFSLPFEEGWGGAFAQQNLVPNPSFEDTTHCPLGLADMDAVSAWHSPTWGSPDLFHMCYNEPDMNVSVPENLLGSQWSRTGNAHAGIILSDFGTNEYREYIQCEISHPLKSGGRYIVSFFVSRSDKATKACDNIGAVLSSESISLLGNANLNHTPQVVSPQNQPIIESVNWTQIIDTMVANGGERYLTIGVFTDNAHTNWIEVEGAGQDEPYYYIDDVSVIQIIDSIDVPNVFTPNGDGNNDNFGITYSGYLEGELKIYDRWGTQVFSTAGIVLEWDGTRNGIDASAGVYYTLLEMKDSNNNRIVKKSFVHLLR